MIKTGIALERVRAGDFLMIDAPNNGVRLWDGNGIPHCVAGHDADTGDAVALVYQATLQIGEVDAVISGGLAFLLSEDDQ